MWKQLKSNTLKELLDKSCADIFLGTTNSAEIRLKTHLTHVSCGQHVENLPLGFDIRLQPHVGGPYAARNTPLP